MKPLLFVNMKQNGINPKTTNLMNVYIGGKIFMRNFFLEHFWKRVLFQIIVKNLVVFECI
ncbi:hypothetical protein N186_00705 [Thermofilum adornatum]|uniref:Uncharacterized protein n=1 Tax=Thermofilum adornatum TaxID=1365176 RepID=S5ZUB5_9CREN|nr:hypothetical protein N186_00705 [Thermofilum adornatum]